MNHLTVKAVSILSGVSAHTLRAWERRYQAVKPSRTSNGRRSYSMADVERLKLLSQLVEQGHAISSVARQSNPKLRELLGKAPNLPDRENSPELQQRVGRSLDSLLSALKAFDLKELGRELRESRISFSPPVFVLRIASPLFHEVGLQVERGSLSVAQEHALSAAMRGELAQLLHAVGTKQHHENLPKFVLTTPEGELHEFGALLGAILCLHLGFETYYLGPSLPAKDLGKAVRVLGIRNIVLGTTAIAKDLLAEPIETYLKRLGPYLPSGSQIWIGGEGKFDPSRARTKHSLQTIATLDMFQHRLEQIKQENEA